MHSTLTHIVKSLLSRDLTTLIFLQGKPEIMQVLRALEKQDVITKVIFPFHSELEFDEIERAKQPTMFARVLLATSKAETAVTRPDVDVVIDLCISRSIQNRNALLEVRDFAASPAITQQRQGRVR